MKIIEAILKSSKVDAVRDALVKVGAGVDGDESRRIRKQERGA